MYKNVICIIQNVICIKMLYEKFNVICVIQNFIEKHFLLHTYKSTKRTNTKFHNNVGISLFHHLYYFSETYLFQQITLSI